LGLVLLMGLLSISCGLIPVQVVERTVVVIETSTQPAPPAATAQTPVDTTATPIPVVSSPPDQSHTPINTRPAVTPTLEGPPVTTQPVFETSSTPTATLLALLVVPVEGDTDKIKAEISYPAVDPFTGVINFQVKAHNPSVGNKDGDGINDVLFSIAGPDNPSSEVYSRDEKVAGYCAFSGGEPDCVLFDMTKAPHTWPGTNNLVTTGSYVLTVTIHAKDGNAWGGSVTFNVKYP
jgi:hypothetical protein